jgi:hypothetical protein
MSLTTTCPENGERTELWHRLERLTRASQVLADDPAAHAAVEAQIAAVQAKLCGLYTDGGVEAATR